MEPNLYVLPSLDSLTYIRGEPGDEAMFVSTGMTDAERVRNKFRVKSNRKVNDSNTIFSMQVSNTWENGGGYWRSKVKHIDKTGAIAFGFTKGDGPSALYLASIGLTEGGTKYFTERMGEIGAPKSCPRKL